MADIFVTDREGVEHRIAATTGKKLMEIIRDAGLPVEALCGGCCSCSTCHVYVDPQWSDRLQPAQSDELDTLSLAFEVNEQSRLSCQIPFEDRLDGIRMTLGPE
jgi:2Fe-2S ferredoxin